MLDKSDIDALNIYLNLFQIVSNIDKEKITNHTINYIKEHDINSLYIIGEVFYSKISKLKIILKKFFSANSINLIHGGIIELNIEELENYNPNVKINTILLFNVQIEKEIERVCKISQVDNHNQYELDINKKMELLTEKMIEITMEL